LDIHRGKTELLASRLSMSLKVIETDTDGAGTYDSLIRLYSDHGPILYRS